MSLRDQWWSIEDWAIAHGITLEDALGEGISQNDDDTIDIPESYHWRPLIAADEYYDTVDVEIIISCQQTDGTFSDLERFRDMIFDPESSIRERFSSELLHAEIDHFRTDTDGNMRFMYLMFIAGRQAEFGLEISRMFPTLTFHMEASNPDTNYFCDDVFYNGNWEYNNQTTFRDQFPDIYREYLEDKQA